MVSLTKALAGVVVSVTLAIGMNDAWAASSGSPQPDTPLDQAAKAVDSGNYRDAIPMLLSIVATDPVNADAHNYLGYSQRKLGQYDDAKINYLKALQIDPEHKGANEYLGELYLELGDLDAAEERLEVLDDACGFFGCEEYDELEEKIEAFKNGNQQS